MSNASNFAKNISNDAEQYYTIIKYSGNPYEANEENSGRIWYDTNEGKLKTIVPGESIDFVRTYYHKTIVPATKTWTTAANINIFTYENAGVGTQNAALVFGGYTISPSFARSALTTEYDGTSWATGGNMILARSNLSGTGSQTAALAIGGLQSSGGSIYSPTTEEYDGTSWATGGNMSISRFQLAAAGTQTAALAFGGNSGSNSSLSSSEEYDGTSWATGGNMIIGRSQHGGAGLQTAALATGGLFTAAPTIENYDGTAWSSSGNLTYKRFQIQTCGSQNSAVTFGGYSFAQRIAFYTEEYNGTSSTLTAVMIGENSNGMGCGTVTAALAANVNRTQKYN